MKKKFMSKPYILFPLLVLVSVFIVVAIQNGDKQKPSFSGVIREVNENSLLILVDEGENARLSSDLISVSLGLKFKGSDQAFEKNQRVKVIYDGVLLESYPAQVSKPYSILIEKN